MLSCYCLFWVWGAVLSKESVEVWNANSDQVDVEIYNRDYPEGRMEELMRDADQIEQLSEHDLPVDRYGAIRDEELEVAEYFVEYNTGDKLMHVSRNNSQTRLKIKIDPSKTNDTETLLKTRVDGIDQELYLSHGLKKTVARFYASHFGKLPNGMDIPIRKFTATTIRSHKKRGPKDKAIKIRYYKGRVYHRPDGSKLRKHTLEMEIWPNLLDKSQTRINVTLGDYEEGKQYMSVAGVEFLFRDDSARFKRCRSRPEKCKITATTTRKRVMLQGKNYNPDIRHDLDPSLYDLPPGMVPRSHDRGEAEGAGS